MLEDALWQSPGGDSIEEDRPVKQVDGVEMAVWADGLKTARSSEDGPLQGSRDALEHAGCCVSKDLLLVEGSNPS